MSNYAIGDVQGCFDELLALLAHLDFDAAHDRLWFVGDIVNRGPRSLDALRFVKAHGEHAHMVLGNHDLHLLATAAGVRPVKTGDTFQQILDAPDRDELLEWLRCQPLLQQDENLGFVMVHAGLPPQWSVAQAAEHARELENTLRSANHVGFFRHMYGSEPALWSDSLTGWARLRYITNALTRIRYCDPEGRLDFQESRPPGEHAADLRPWFAMPGRMSAQARIVFGHWATLQLHTPLSPEFGVCHIDSGCVWGGTLTALRLEDGRYFSVAGRQSERRA